MLMESHAVGFDFRPEAGRAIVCERNTVHHKLSLIFRSTRMQHRISFVEPARLRIHQVLQRAAGHGADPVLNRIRSNLADGARLIGINQSILRGDGCGLIHGGKFELDCEFRGNRRTNFYRFGNRRET